MRIQHSATFLHVLEPLRKIRLAATSKMSNHHRPYSQGMRGGEGIADKALSVLSMKDVSDFDIPSSVALEILVKTGQCLAKFQIDTPIRIYICKAFTFRLHQIHSLTNSDDIVHVYFFLQCIKQFCKR